MAFNSAQAFLQKMREDKNFREMMQNFGDREKLWKAIKDKGYDFDERDLIQAMAACMAEPETSGL
ncbi:MAG: Nif11-like leader peptide family natural product precursor [Deltaproteobacteria bacterium]|jgi:predicted ribosomally synthesized peptide with nif11-like leader|nr:Nif11-like leader peptide family natural product precursor [Deltaproteobacteria bacterium]